MRRMLSIFVMVTLASVGSLLGGDVEELKARFKKAVQALNERNLDGFLAMVHPQGLSFYSCSPTTHKEGKEACEEDWKLFFASATKADFNTDKVNVRVIGNTGIVWGTYSAIVKGKDGKAKSYSGRYSLVYAKVDGAWWVVWQENSPALSS